MAKKRVTVPTAEPSKRAIAAPCTFTLEQFARIAKLSPVEAVEFLLGRQGFQERGLVARLPDGDFVVTSKGAEMFRNIEEHDG